MVGDVLNQILDKIERLYFDSDSNNHDEISQLWTNYYKIASNYNVELDRAYQLYLLGENISYINDTKIHYERPNVELVNNAKEKLLSVIDLNKGNGLVRGITLDEAKILLDYAIYNTWLNISHFGIDIENNSLNGFCEFAQICSIYPFEQIELKVTKNKAKDTFNYLFNHAFGTVTFPIQDDSGIHEVSFLVDPTYKQFFTTVRCNEGRYYTKEENTDILTAPDPGYFMNSSEEKEFASNLISCGYIQLTLENAKIYGTGFQKASINIKEKNNYNSKFDFNTNYFNLIMNNSSNYKTTLDELTDYGIDLNIFNISYKKR